MREGLKWERERDRFMGDLVVDTVVATWTQWVDLKVAAQSRNGSLTRWFNLGVGCSHSGQNGLGVGCSWQFDWLRGWVIHWVSDDEEWVAGIGWVSVDEGWVSGVPSPCSAWGIGLLSLGMSPTRICFKWIVLVCVSRSLSVLSLLALSLSLSLSLGVYESRNHLKVK